jgi:hypothetical protein
LVPEEAVGGDETEIENQIKFASRGLEGRYGQRAWRILRVNVVLSVRKREIRNEPISKCVTGGSLEQKQAEIKMSEVESSPNRSSCDHALGGSPRKTLGLCDLLDVSRCHVDGEGWGVWANAGVINQYEDSL